jgi:hypothetical protein
MTIEIGSSRARMPSFCISFLLTFPGLFVGYLGITDMAPSSPQGFAGLAEIFGFGFWAWAILSSIRLLINRFLEDVFGQIGSLFAAGVIAYGFYLLMTVIGLEATFEHKRAFTWVLQPLGWIALFLLISKFSRRFLRTQDSALDKS